uniref:Uncharacterized protein n=1 Tax=Anguilla anguilla TaxID=7936 RepID=A0A0E9XB62_ANGAN
MGDVQLEFHQTSCARSSIRVDEAESIQLFFQVFTAYSICPCDIKGTISSRGAPVKPSLSPGE